MLSHVQLLLVSSLPHPHMDGHMRVTQIHCMLLPAAAAPAPVNTCIASQFRRAAAMEERLGYTQRMLARHQKTTIIPEAGIGNQNRSNNAYFNRKPAGPESDDVAAQNGSNGKANGLVLVGSSARVDCVATKQPASGLGNGGWAVQGLVQLAGAEPRLLTMRLSLWCRGMHRVVLTHACITADGPSGPVTGSLTRMLVLHCRCGTHASRCVASRCHECHGSCCEAGLRFTAAACALV